MDYLVDFAALMAQAERSSADFAAAEPYPHCVIDGFFKPEAAQALAAGFPSANDPVGWDRYAVDGYEVKFGLGREESMPALHRLALYQLNSGPAIRWLEKLSGIPHLLPDPHLAGGGLHLTRRGGHLGIHADFNWHAQLAAHRRLNLLIYLTPDWRPEYAGQLELWDTAAQACCKRIDPLFNRAVLFATRSDTFHGHPQPWAAPEANERRSLALYYYTARRPADEQRDPHSTLYKGYHVP